jgi:hypothetical protein
LFSVELIYLYFFALLFVVKLSHLICVSIDKM